MSKWRQLALLIVVLAAPVPAFGQTQISGNPTLTWQDAESGLDGFSVGRWINGGSEELIATVPPTTFTYVDSGLTAGVTYCYHVYAFNQYGSSAPSDDACGTVASATSGVTTTSAPPPLTIYYLLTVSERGKGTVRSSPEGIACGNTCNASFPAGSIVNLAATPGKNFVLAGWGGACSGTGTCSVTMSQAQRVSATFKHR